MLTQFILSAPTWIKWIMFRTSDNNTLAYNFLRSSIKSLMNVCQKKSNFQRSWFMDQSLISAVRILKTFIIIITHEINHFPQDAFHISIFIFNLFHLFLHWARTLKKKETENERDVCETFSLTSFLIKIKQRWTLCLKVDERERCSH